MNEWIDWHGGECPVDDECLVVEVGYRGGSFGKDFAKEFDWIHDNKSWNIIKYRVVSDTSKLSDAQTKPIQYQIGINTFDRAKANMTPDEILAVCKFNIDRYAWRVKGQDKDDFKKIKDYADLALWAIEKKEKQ